MPGRLWAGTDDGLVWITHDRRPNWKNITPAALTPWSKVAQIDASRFDDRHGLRRGEPISPRRLASVRLRDARRRRDAGELAVSGLPECGPSMPCAKIRSSRVCSTPLPKTASTFRSMAEHRWQSLQLSLPHTSVRDLIVHGNDVVVATHGRGLLDSRRRRAAARVGDHCHPEQSRRAGQGASLHSGAARIACGEARTPIRRCRPRSRSGENPPDGAILDYALASPARRVVISIFDDAERPVRRYASDDARSAPIPHLDKPAYWERPFVRPSTGAGMHRFVWDLREPPPRSLQQDLPISAVLHDTPRVPEGPLVVPGRYSVRLEVDGRSSGAPSSRSRWIRASRSRSASTRASNICSRGESRAHRPKLRRGNAPPKRAGRAKAAAAFEAINDDGRIAPGHGRWRRRSADASGRRGGSSARGARISTLQKRSIPKGAQQ